MPKTRGSAGLCFLQKLGERIGPSSFQLPVAVGIPGVVGASLQFPLCGHMASSFVSEFSLPLFYGNTSDCIGRNPG